mgnify:CR=1 FL=1
MKNKKEVEMEKEKKVLLKKEKEIILFVKSEKAKAIKLVNLDLSEYIMLNEPMKIRAA